MSNPEPLILSLETSSRTGGVAVLRGSDVLAEKDSGEKSSHSEQLLSDIQEILHKSDLDLKQICLLAATVGPGSFTGLRIGLATAKALAAALKIPAAGISTLEAVAACSESDGEICAVLPAGRNEFFVQSFKKNQEKDLKSISLIEIYTIQKLTEKAAGKNDLIWMANEEINLLISEAAKNTNSKCQILPGNLAISVGRIAYKIFLCGNLDENPLRPIYVRGADIGIHKNAK